MAGVELATSWSPAGHAYHWATITQNRAYQSEAFTIWPCKLIVSITIVSITILHKQIVVYSL